MKVEEIKRVLDEHGFSCWVDSGARMRGHSSMSSRSTHSTLTSAISLTTIQTRNHTELPSTQDNNSQRGLKSASAVICCITPKYLQSENCITDLRLAESLNKPVIAILLRFSTWPPEGSPPSVKKSLSKVVEVIEMYNDKLYRQNLPLIVDKTRKVLAAASF